MLLCALTHSNWTGSKANGVTHHPSVGPIHRLSLCYPLSTRPALVVGKIRGLDSPAGPNPGNNGSKTSRREKYEAHIAHTTRPPPYILSAGLAVGGVVRSDPLSGKVSKGYWGPRSNANFHLRPHLDPADPPTTMFVPMREQHFGIWGLASGRVVRSIMTSKAHTSNRTRATSANIKSEADDAHEGLVQCIWASSPDIFVSGGVDGRVKLWKFEAPAVVGKKAHADQAGRVLCVFSSTPSETPFDERSEEMRIRQGRIPDGVVCVRYDEAMDTVVSVTEDGELKVWFGVTSGGEVKEVRVDVGSKAEYGGVAKIELDLHQGKQGVASVMVLHHGDPDLHWPDHDLIHRFDITSEGDVKRIPFIGAGAVTAVHADLAPSSPISQATNVPATPSVLADPEIPSGMVASICEESKVQYGRYVVVGNAKGDVMIYPWDNFGLDGIHAMRKWSIGRGAVSSVDASASLVAVGT